MLKVICISLYNAAHNPLSNTQKASGFAPGTACSTQACLSEEHLHVAGQKCSAPVQGLTTFTILVAVAVLPALSLAV